MYTGIVYQKNEDGRLYVLVCISFKDRPFIFEHDDILKAYSKKYDIPLDNLILAVSATIPDPRD